MKHLFWGVISVLIFGLLARIDIGGGGILLMDIVLPFFLIIWGIKKVFLREPIESIPWMPCAGLFLLWAFISFWFGAVDLDTKSFWVSFSYIFRLGFFLLFALAAADIFKDSKTKKSQEFFPKFFKISGIIVLLGFIQFYALPDISDFSTKGGWDPHIGRLLGTWLDPNYLAGFLSFVLPLALAYMYESFDSKKTKRGRWVLGLVALILVALFLTFSRSGYLAAAMGILFFFLFRNPKILVIGALVLILGISLNERAQKRVEELSGTFSAILFQQTDEIDPTASLRLQNWQKSLALVEKYPLVGIGYNTYRYKAAEEGIVDESYFSAGGADSTHLTVLVTTGIIGFFFYILWFWRMFVGQFRLFWRSSKTEYAWLHLGASAGILALFVHASFVNSLFFPLIFVPVMAVFGFLNSRTSYS